MLIPLINTSPLVGLSKAPNMLSRVLFPLPEGPTIDTNSPFFTLNVMFLTPVTLPDWESQYFDRFLTIKAELSCSLEGLSVKLSFLSDDTIQLCELLAILKQLGTYTPHHGTYNIQNVPFVSL
jgi:hypothetical protein